MALILLENKEHFTNPKANFSITMGGTGMPNTLTNIIRVGYGNVYSDTTQMPDGNYEITVDMGNNSSNGGSWTIDSGTYSEEFTYMHGKGADTAKYRRVTFNRRVDKGVGNHITWKAEHGIDALITFKWLGAI